MKTMRQQLVYSTIRNILALTFIISGCSGLIHAFFNCSNYTFHENATEGRSWETSRVLCQNSSEGDLVSIEEEEERNFVKNIIKNLPVIKFIIGLKKENGKWKWLSNQTTVDSSQGQSPWAPGQPSGTSKPDRKDNCAAIYGIYLSHLGRFDDMSCSRRMKNAGHICEKALSCTKNERGTSFQKKTTQVSPVHSTTRMSSQGQPNPQATKERERATSVHSTTSTQCRTQSLPSTAEIDSITPDQHATKERKKATPVHSITRTVWKSQPFPSRAEIDSITPDRHATKEGQGATSVHSITRTRWKTQPFPSTAEIESIAPVTTHLEKADESSNLIAIIVSVLASFVILGTAAALLLFLVYRSRKKDHVMQDLGEEPSQLMVDEENCKPSADTSSAGLEKELTRDEDAIVKQDASGQDQCIDCVYAVVDETKKKRPPTKPAPYQKLVYADLSHSPKKSKDGIHQESTGTIYADIDHVESSAMSDSGSQQENEVELTE